MHAHRTAGRVDDAAPSATPTPEHPIVTVRALLAEPTLQGRLTGGEAGLDNAVAWCLPWGEVAAGDHGARTGSIRDLDAVVVHLDAAELSTYDRARALISGLQRRGAAALLAWPGRAHTEVDLQAPAQAADEMGVPLVAVAREADFRSAGYLVASKVLAQSAHVLEYSVRVHRALGEVFAQGAGLAALTRTMSQLAQSPVLVMDNDAEQLAYADVDAGGLPVDLLAGPVARSLGHGDDDGSSDSSCHLVNVDVEGETWHAMAAPINVATDTFGVVAVLEPTWPAGDHDLAQHAVIAEQGSTLLGSELLRQRSVHAAEERARGDFVDTLLHGRFSDQHELAARAQYYRFDPQGRFAVFVVTPPEPAQRTSAAAAPHRAFSRLGHSLESSLADDRLMLTAAIGSMLVVIREFPASLQQGADALAERKARRLFGDRLQRQSRAVLKHEVQVTHGRAGTGAAGVADSYREARTAAALARRSSAPEVCGYDDLRVFAAVQEVAGSASGRAFAAEVLEPLRRADGQTGDLEHIVLAYINESGNLNAAARRLHLHRNTMLYKLDRASRTMQMDVRNAETQFMIWLAHHIDGMSQVQSALDSELTPP